MKYFKNAEVSRLYSISEKAVRNWIDNAKTGSLDLELYEENGKSYIADTLTNETRLEAYTERAKKYRSSLTHKRIRPNPLLYSLYTYEEVLQIIADLRVHKEFPQQYRYRGQAAIDWSSYLHKLHKGYKGNTLTNTTSLVNLNEKFISYLLQDFEHINIVDLGVGNGLGARPIIEIANATNKLRKYVGIDLSPELLSITKHNIHAWFGDKIAFEDHVIDFEWQRFRELLARDSYGTDMSKIINLVLLFGGTISNFRDRQATIKSIRESIGMNDILLLSLKLDTPTSRRFFDFNLDKQNTLLPLHDRHILDLLNISSNFYDFEQFFDKSRRARHLGIKLRYSISIEFEFGAHKSILELEKDDSILLWRAWHAHGEDIIKLLEDNGLTMLHASETKDQQTLLAIVKVDTRSTRN